MCVLYWVWKSFHDIEEMLQKMRSIENGENMILFYSMVQIR